jgi:hypothetical protein
VGAGAAAQAATFIELSLAGCAVSRFGVGLHANLLTSALQGFCSALNRLLEELPATQRQRLLQRAQPDTAEGDIDTLASAS